LHSELGITPSLNDHSSRFNCASTNSILLVASSIEDSGYRIYNIKTTFVASSIPISPATSNLISPSTSSIHQNSDSGKTDISIVLAVSGAIVVLVCGLTFVVYWRRHSWKKLK
jgi:hypothetical protein